MPFRATNAANWSSIIRIGAKMAVIRRQIAHRADSSHTQRAGKVPYGESRFRQKSCWKITKGVRREAVGNNLVRANNAKACSTRTR